MIIQVIIGATKGLKKNLGAKPGKHSVDSLQNAAMLGTSHTIYRNCCGLKLEA